MKTQKSPSQRDRDGPAGAWPPGGRRGCWPPSGTSAERSLLPAPASSFISVEQRGLCRHGGFPRRPCPWAQVSGGAAAGRPSSRSGGPPVVPRGPMLAPCSPLPSVDKKPYIRESRVHGVSFPTHSLGPPRAAPRARSCSPVIPCPPPGRMAVLGRPPPEKDTRALLHTRAVGRGLSRAQGPRPGEPLFTRGEGVALPSGLHDHRAAGFGASPGTPSLCPGLASILMCLLLWGVLSLDAGLAEGRGGGSRVLPGAGWAQRSRLSRCVCW